MLTEPQKQMLAELAYQGPIKYNGRMLKSLELLKKQGYVRFESDLIINYRHRTRWILTAYITEAGRAVV